MVLRKDASGEKVNESSDVFVVKIGRSENAREKSFELVGIHLFQCFKGFIDKDFDVIGLSVFSEIIPVCFIWDYKSIYASVLVDVIQCHLDELGAFGVILAFWIVRQILKFPLSLFIFHGEEPEKDEG